LYHLCLYLDNPAKYNNMKKILVLLLTLPIITFAQQFSDGEVQSFLRSMSQQINEICPKLIDSETKLISTSTVDYSRVIQYNHILVNRELLNIDVESLKTKFYPIVLNDAQTNPGYKFFRENDVTMIFSYKDKNGNFVFKYIITSDFYSSSKSDKKAVKNNMDKKTIENLAELHLSGLKDEMGLISYTSLGDLYNLEDYSICFTKKITSVFNEYEMNNLTKSDNELLLYISQSCLMINKKK
jgi:hypothetical protein